MALTALEYYKASRVHLKAEWAMERALRSYPGDEAALAMEAAKEIDRSHAETRRPSALRGWGESRARERHRGTKDTEKK